MNLTVGNDNIDIGSVGVAGESGIIRIGTIGTHTDAFLPGFVHATDADPRFIASGSNSAGFEATVAASQMWFAGAASDFDFKIRDVTASNITFINIDDGQTTTRFIGFCGQQNANFPIEVSSGGDTTNGNGARLTGTGVWTDASSRTFKENFKPVNTAAVLKKVTELPVRTWSYKGVPSVTHMGSVAEDFKDTFGFGRR